MPSEYRTWVPLPGNGAMGEAGTWPSDTGKVTGRCPPGSVRPKSTLASAVPLTWPGYQPSTTAATLGSHGMATGAPALITTTVRGLAAATAEMSSACADGRFRVRRGAPPDAGSAEPATHTVP